MSEVKLTPVHIRYLLVMNKLRQQEKDLRVSAIAKETKLSKTSAHVMLRHFAEVGLVNQEYYRAAFFTPLGEEISEKMAANYVIVEKWLKKSFPLAEDVEMAACSLLAHISDEAMDEFIGRKAPKKKAK